MPIIVQCPACGRKLRVPDELLGKKVKCPGCGGTFTGEDRTSPPAPSAEPKAESKPPAPSGIAGLDDLNLELDEEPAPPPPPPPPPPRPPSPPPPSQRPRKEEIVRQETAPEPVRPKPASKPKPKPREEEDDGKEPCPFCGERIRPNSIRCKYCGEELDDEEEDDYEEERPSRRGRKSGRGIRRHALPHRGGMVLTLGIISVVSLVLDLLLACCCFPAGWVTTLVGMGTGIPAWILGQRDLAKMRTGEMDPSGRGSTQGGWICGMIGTILNVLFFIGGVIIVILYGALLSSGLMMNPPGGSGGQSPFGPPPGPGRKFSVEPGTLKLWHYLPSREMNTGPDFGK